MSSYEKINYNLRPAKQIERKMLMEVFRNLSDFGTIESYRYVGFGSIYFSDFYQIHKLLGITDMTSIEKDEHNKERFEFNYPFSCINIEWGNSVDVLPNLRWEQRTILWLDYDGTLTEDVFSDITCFCTNAIPGSMIIVSVNAEPERFPSGLRSEELTEYFASSVTNLKKRVGENKVPSDIDGKSLRKWGTAKVCRRIINNHILENLKIRNGARTQSNQLIYNQLFNFHYSDGTKMLTVGGLIYDTGQTTLFNKAMFDERYNFVSTGDIPYHIQVPKLTYRELRYLDTQLPTTDINQLTAPNIPEDDLKIYSELYRYFPTFAETDI